MGKVVSKLSAGKQQREDSYEDLGERQDLKPRGNSRVAVYKGISSVTERERSKREDGKKVNNEYFFTAFSP